MSVGLLVRVVHSWLPLLRFLQLAVSRNWRKLNASCIYVKQKMGDEGDCMEDSVELTKTLCLLGMCQEIGNELKRDNDEV